MTWLLAVLMFFMPSLGPQIVIGSASGGGGGYTVNTPTACYSAGGFSVKYVICTIPSTVSGNKMYVDGQSSFGNQPSVVCDGPSCGSTCTGTSTDTLTSDGNLGNYGHQWHIDSVTGGLTTVCISVGAGSNDDIGVIVTTISGGGCFSSCQDQLLVGCSFGSTFSCGPTSTLAQAVELALGVQVSTGGMITPVASGWTSAINASGNSAQNNLALMYQTTSSTTAITWSGTATNGAGAGSLTTTK